MTKKQQGGRVTAKGTQPAGTAKTPRQTLPGFGPARSNPGRIVPVAARRAVGPVGPTRSGHHRGNR